MKFLIILCMLLLTIPTILPLFVGATGDGPTCLSSSGKCDSVVSEPTTNSSNFAVHSILELSSLVFSYASWPISKFYIVAKVAATFIGNLIPQQLKLLILPTVYGTAMVSFSWMLIYYDSKVPGVYPPTPISPAKHRAESGHTFHLGYSMGLFNGLIVFILTLWQHTFY